MSAAGGAASLAGRPVLVTGASGFLGGWLCRQLSAAGAEVHAVSRRAAAPGGAVARWWQGELAEFAFCRELLAAVRPDTVFHLASHVAGARRPELVEPTLRANLTAAVALLEAATATPCRRIVLAGSMEEPEPGDAAPVPSSPYAAAKWAASGYARMFHALWAVPVVTARIFMVYGPGQGDLRKLVPYVSLELAAGRSPELSSGDRPIDWIYAEDVARGLLALATAPGLEGRTLDLGSGRQATVREVVERLHALSGAAAEPRFGALGDRPLEQVRLADVEATAAATGWRPRVDLEDGLARTYAWYAERRDRLA